MGRRGFGERGNAKHRKERPHSDLTTVARIKWRRTEEGDRKNQGEQDMRGTK